MTKKNTNKTNSTNNTTKKHYLIVGKPVMLSAKSDGKYTLSYSNRETFREIVTDFARYIDKTENKKKAVLFADIISQLDDKKDGMVYRLMEEMFGYKIEMISEINSVYTGTEFLKALKMRVNDNNPPLPF